MGTRRRAPRAPPRRSRAVGLPGGGPLGHGERPVVRGASEGHCEPPAQRRCWHCWVRPLCCGPR
eukprot:2209576-Alexandrium_andersonii.AAC.1